jgi:hypothetical protein
MASFDDFKTRFETGGSDPEAVVRLLIEGMCTLETDSDLGEQMVALVCSKKILDPAPETLSGFRFRRTDDSLDRLRRNADIARSYAGGTHGNDYRDANPAAPRVTLDTVYSARAQGIDYPQAGQAKLFVASGGADTPRPVTLARNNAGLWKVVNFSSLTVGVRPPATEAGDF